MTRKSRYLQGIAAMAVLAMAECAGLVAVEVALTGPAHAQFTDNRYPSLGRQRPPRSGGFFQQLFGAPSSSQVEREQAPADYSRAPAQRKPDPSAEPVTPTTSVVVMGDGMADWLAYGLEDAFSDTPEVGIVRRSKTHSGLLHYDAKNDLDWWHAVRDILALEKPNYVIMMLGVGDRQNIREKDLAKEAEKKKEEKDKGAQKDAPISGEADKSAQSKSAEAADQAIIAPEPQPIRKTNGIIEFRSEQWEKIYPRRIDETVAALKSKGVPVFWVGLPSIRGTRSTADVVYLNDLYRARAERAGAVYVDVWDGFIDETGKFSSFGPDYEGQIRRLRAGDGVYFTKFGARKLAHYVERELRRYMSNRGPVALPSGPMGPVPADGKSAARPLIGPVVPLTMASGNSDVLLGASGAALARGDAIATDVLVKGDPVVAPPGRADDFIWPRDSAAKPAASAASAPAAAAVLATAPATVAAKPAAVVTKPASVVTKPEPVIANPEPVAKPQPAQAAIEPAAKLGPNAVEKPKPVELKPPQTVDNRLRPPRPVAPRPQQPVGSSGGLFGPNGPFGFIR